MMNEYLGLLMCSWNGEFIGIIIGCSDEGYYLCEWFPRDQPSWCQGLSNTQVKSGIENLKYYYGSEN